MNYRFQVSPDPPGYQYEIASLSGRQWKLDSRAGFLTEAEARQACLLRLRDLLETPTEIDPTLTFLDMAKIMLQGIPLSSATRKTYRSRLNAFARLHDRPLQMITGADLQAILDIYQTTHSQATTLGVAAFGRRIFDCAARECRLIPSNPFDEISLQSPAEQPMDHCAVLSPEKTAGILESLEGEERLLIALMILSGLRLAEALALHREDIDLWGERISLQRMKNSDGYETLLKSPGPARILPLPEAVRNLVIRRPPTFNHRLFLEEHSAGSVQKALRPHGVTMEGLRRSYIQSLFDQGTNLDVAAWLSGEPMERLRAKWR